MTAPELILAEPPGSGVDGPALAPVLTPHGRLLLSPAHDAAPLEPALARRLEHAFARGSGHGLLQLGAAEIGTLLPPVLRYWRDFGARYVSVLCTHVHLEDTGGPPPIPPPGTGELEALVAGAPPMTGAEYVSVAVLESLWTALDGACRVELAESGDPLQAFLKRRSPAWNLVGRVHFNLAENRLDDEAPFAFLATYTGKLTTHARAQHQPLGHALREYAGERNRERLLSLLLPVQRAAAHCGWLKALVDSGEIYHPLRWSAEEAWRLLNDIPALEAAGVIVRVPGAWKGARPPRPRVTASVGGKPPIGIGADALLDFRIEVTLDGEPLTRAEMEALLAGSQGLALVRGRWVEVDRERVKRLLDEFQRVEAAAARGGVSFAEAMRMLAGTSGPDTASGDIDREWSNVVPGAWLEQTLADLRSPEGLARVAPGRELKSALRAYQQSGLQWLYLLYRLKLGACLADDMGLGKTIQVLALLLVLKRNRDGGQRPSILVAPASLLANWAAEIARHTPSIDVLVAHPSVTPIAGLKDIEAQRLARCDLVVTSYAYLARVPALSEMRWRLAVLDEAQAIKNPGARQTRATKALKAEARIALTGTPVENRLGDLWSIFDFLNPGLLGSRGEFTECLRRLASRPHNPYAPLRELVRPYILRRLKTDKAVIADLPDKTEVKAYCHLTPRQAALYQQSVKELAARLSNTADGVQRKGMILSFLMRFKQICNHPSHWLTDGGWDESDSGKMVRLREIGEVIAAKQEKALVFTQFREATEPLAGFLAGVFGRPGLVLHGGTAVRSRQKLVQRFQEDETVPFMVLSLKAGGAGLNLTAASHVVHYDRWWNPAVENQATDRAFRIGQKRNVLVHKFVCRGTVEEKIDELIEAKRAIAEDVLAGGSEIPLTEMNDNEILKLVALDVRAATA